MNRPDNTVTCHTTLNPNSTAIYHDIFDRASNNRPAYGIE